MLRPVILDVPTRGGSQGSPAHCVESSSGDGGRNDATALPVAFPVRHADLLALSDLVLEDKHPYEHRPGPGVVEGAELRIGALRDAAEVVDEPGEAAHPFCVDRKAQMEAEDVVAGLGGVGGGVAEVGNHEGLRRERLLGKQTALAMRGVLGVRDLLDGNLGGLRADVRQLGVRRMPRGCVAEGRRELPWQLGVEAHARQRLEVLDRAVRRRISLRRLRGLVVPAACWGIPGDV